MEKGQVSNKNIFARIGSFLKEKIRGFSAILKLQLDNRFSAGSKTSKKDKLAALIKNLIIFIAIFAICWFLISKIKTFLMIKFNQEFFSVVMLVVLTISLVFSISNVITTMFLSKDNELLLCLPTSFDQLYLSKLVLLYINELVFNILYIFPIMLAIGVCGGETIPGFYYLVIIVLFPILPFASLAIASLLALPVMAVFKFLKDRPRVAVVVSLVAIVALFVFYMLFISSISGAFNITEKQSETSYAVNDAIANFGKKIPILHWLSAMFLSFNRIYRLFVFMVGFVLIFAVSAFIVRFVFQKISTFNNENKNTTKPKKRHYRRRSVVSELLLNEFRSCLRSPSIIIQFFLFPLLMPIIVYTYDKLLFSIAVNQTGQALIFASHVLVLCIVTTLSSAISSTALSKEGGLLYFAKMIPVSYEKQASIKIAFNFIISSVAIVLTTIVCCVFNPSTAGLLIVASVAALFISFGHICQSYDIDLRNPSLNWYDVSEISALSKNTTASILHGMLISVIFTVLAVVGGGNVVTTLVLLVIPAAAYGYGRFRLLRIRLKTLFGRIEI